MSRNYEAAICKKLRNLQNTQGSIQKTSRALLKNKHLAKDIVKLWFKEFRAAPDGQKLAFLHLANDIIQNGLSSAPQFAKLFEPVLSPAFRETARLPSNGIRSAIAHLLIVWADRQVYPRAFLRQLRSICQTSAAQADSALDPESVVDASPFAFSFTSALINASALSCQTRQRPQQQQPPFSVAGDPTPDAIATGGDSTPGSTPGRRNLSVFREELQRGLQLDAIKVVKTSELIKELEALQSTPSGDAATRQTISEFPTEVSDVQSAKKLVEFDKLKAEQLLEQVRGALNQLDAYNRLLDEEMSQRTNLGLSLPAYRSFLQEEIRQTRALIEVGTF
uniref:CID domain-containing protein n=2 Tax=Schistocephalus solidus TaxID=70667 RepID=A0A0X3P2K8_SCHSO